MRRQESMNELTMENLSLIQMWAFSTNDTNQSTSEAAPWGNRSGRGGAVLTSDSEYIFDRQLVRGIFITVYTIVFCSCFFGNLVVILVINLHWRMRSITNFCLSNLAFANLCVGVFCVYQNLSTYLITSWVFGDFMCKMYHFINSLSHTASILILVVICIERYLAIIHPIRSRQILTINRLRVCITGVWIISAIYCSPRLYYITTITIPRRDGAIEILCIPKRTLYDSQTFDVINFFLIFLVPLAIISILYTSIGITLWRTSRNPVMSPTESSINTSSRSSADCIRGSVMESDPQGRASPLPDTLTLDMARIEEEADGSCHLTCFRLSSSKLLALCVGENEAARMPEVIESEKDVGHCGISNISLALDTQLAIVVSKRVVRSQEAGNQTIPHPHHGPSIIHPIVREQPKWRRRSRLFRFRREGKVRRTFRKELLEGRKSSTVAKSTTRPEQGAGGADLGIPVGSKLRRRGGMRNARFGAQALQSRRRVIRMLIVIVVTFALCNLPFHGRKMWQIWSSSYKGGSVFSTLFTPITFIIMYANCAINPILYAFMSTTFRQSFGELLRCRLRKRHVYQNRSETVVASNLA